MVFRGIYIHIPFCNKKCNYCSFFSVDAGHSEYLQEQYVEALLREIEIVANSSEHKKVQSIYIGGGTPSVLPSSAIERIMKRCFSLFDVGKDAECTIEINPATIDEEKLKGYKKYGINRISIGAQSFFNKSLDFLGRAHNRDDIFKAVDICRGVDIYNINLDLMFGYKGQTLADWEEDIKTVLDIEPAHISLYDLSVEEGSRFYLREDKDSLVLDEDTYLKMYDIVADKVGSRYIHYEISNFALKKENISRHNMLYWGNSEYFGFGAGAFFYIDGYRGLNERDIPGYCAKIAKGVLPILEKEKLDIKTKIRETFVLNLRRLKKGASVSSLEKEYKYCFEEDFIKKLVDLEKEKMLKECKGVWRLTRKGIALFNQVASELI